MSAKRDTGLKANRSTWLLIVTAALILARWDGVRPASVVHASAPDETLPPEPSANTDERETLGQNEPEPAFWGQREFNFDVPGKKPSLKLLSILVQPDEPSFRPIQRADGVAALGAARFTQRSLRSPQTRAPPFSRT